MRDTVNMTWSVQIIILFILIFAAFLSLVIQYSKAYMIKNEVLNILEKYEGGIESKEIISQYIMTQGYKTKGKCPNNWYGVTDYNSEIVLAEENKKYLYCVHKIKRYGSTYYEIQLFYKFNLPVIGEVTTFRVEGRTTTFQGYDSQLVN